MIFESLHPLESRTQFKTRTLRTWAAILGAFVILLFLLLFTCSLLLPGTVGKIVAFLIAATVACVLYALYNSRPVRLRCCSCQKIILGNTPWVCGACGGKHYDATEFSFLNRCQHCGAEPKAYRCHHKNCGQPIFFTVDESELNLAHCLNTQGQPSEDEADARQARDRLREKRVKEHAVAMRELDVQLKKHQAELEGPKIRSHRETAIKAFDDEYDGTMAVEEHLARRRKEIEEEFKDDPTLLKRAKKALEEAARRQI
jgi:hypothetical protein